MRCCAASGRGRPGPLGITTGGGEAFGACVCLYKFSDSIVTLDQARDVINEQLSSNNTSDNNNTNIFGAFIVFVQSCTSLWIFGVYKNWKDHVDWLSVQHVNVGSYGEIPDWLNRAILLRGKATTRAYSTNGWEGILESKSSNRIIRGIISNIISRH